MTTVSVVSAIAVRENVVRVRFDSAPYYSGVLDPGDASDLARWSLFVDPSSADGDGDPPRPVAPARAVLASSTSIDVWCDRRFSSFPARYTVRANGLFSSDLSGTLVTDTASFFAVRAGTPAPLPDAGVSNADIANPQTVSGMLGQLPLPDAASLGTLPVDDTGDIARQGGIEAYKKRVIRRLTTRKNRYAHLPGYGTLLPESVKTLARPGTLASLEADAEDQIRQEPETISVRVRVENVGGVFYFRIRVRCSLGTAFDLSVPLSIG